MLLKEVTAVYSQYHMTPINTLYGQNSQLLIITAGDTHSYH
jgi:hypothetical protein